MRPLALAADGRSIEILDQTRLPHEEVTVRLASRDDVARAIRTMQVRGAPLIGITASYGLCLALRADPSDAALEESLDVLLTTRPTAVNLRWALARMAAALRGVAPGERAERGYAEAGRIADEEVAACRAIAAAGLPLLRTLAAAASPARPLDVLTHCNAGRLATLGYGTALAPVYRAHEEGMPLHVWVNETRPRSQGWLTAWELGRAGVPHTVVADTAAGWLFGEGRVDLVLVGADRVARNGDVCNKIGTRLISLAAREARVPVYAAFPSSTIDWEAESGAAIPIERRAPEELTVVRGRERNGSPAEVRVAPDGTAVLNPAFDVTPASLLTGLITDRGVCIAGPVGLRELYPGRFP
ncbi:MAG TPA: S-methyl-5-thioribose-1-phosphate isomerase [Gemmatimonadales bacterium]|nr:S-methyl-5-thioribose-1-phosphate isomerase [Gemmatimonadales bacterium]